MKMDYNLNQRSEIQGNIDAAIKVIRLYEWLLDLYVLDFFVDNHWGKLPRSWKNSLQDIDPTDLGKTILGVHTKHMLPLSLLSLITVSKTYSIPREQINLNIYKSSSDSNSEYSCGNHPRLKNLFLKHVKLKKRHEISLMADVVKTVSSESNCEAVVDFGSGLGHLIRILAYKHDLFTAGIECQEQLTAEARKHDAELEYTAQKHLSSDSMATLRRPLHLNVTLSSIDQLHQIALPETMKKYGLIGLHPCGDLGPLLIKHFVNHTSVKFICVVGCCYMKLTSDGYPLSKYVGSLKSQLSYMGREIACHAIEVYCGRLVQGSYEDLKIHAFRAALERILVEFDPKFKHAPIRSIKHLDKLTFTSYCALALERLPVPIPSCDIIAARAAADLAQWRRVVVVYTLRLLMAPLVETVVLLDRMLYLLENDMSCEIIPVFDPALSPRNHIIIGRRKTA